MVERVIAATDGSAQPNPGPTGWAWVLADAEGTPCQGASGFLGDATNNVGELTAVAELLKATAPVVPLEIRIDSQYAMNVVTGGYRAAKNRELVARIRRMVSGRDVVFTWVRAHQDDGDMLNAIADQTADQAVANRHGQTWTGSPPSMSTTPSLPATPRPTDSPDIRSIRVAATTPARCRATTKTGKPCTIDPRPSELCHVHDPQVQCQAITRTGRRCTVATGGGRCPRHRDQLL
ncbi:RNase H family protein [Actinopolymorpha sp. B17G11]|uniref:ribonuclease HI n=1 Tax=Actinopolymorpha sp. B17G11 TaxID=3160861 RepID=UPI0032E40B5F